MNSLISVKEKLPEPYKLFLLLDKENAVECGNGKVRIMVDNAVYEPKENRNIFSIINTGECVPIDVGDLYWSYPEDDKISYEIHKI